MRACVCECVPLPSINVCAHHHPGLPVCQVVVYDTESLEEVGAKYRFSHHIARIDLSLSLKWRVAKARAALAANLITPEQVSRGCCYRANDLSINNIVVFHLFIEHGTLFWSKLLFNCQMSTALIIRRWHPPLT